MTTLRRSLTADLAAPPDDVFALLTDLDRLPDWNEHVRAVTESPEALVPGATWVITMHAFGSTWQSRSTVLAVDEATRTFTHRTVTDDGNPSFALWTWEVVPNATGTGSTVEVTYELNPKTFLRRVVLARIRHRQLQREMRASLAEADRLLSPVPGRAG